MRPQKSDVIYGCSLPSYINLNVDYLNLPEQAFGHLAVQVAAPAKAVEAAVFEAAETSEFEVIDMMVVLESGEQQKEQIAREQPQWLLLKLEGVQKNDLRLAKSLCLKVSWAWKKIVLLVVAVALEADLENHSVATIKNHKIVK